ncbi:MAG TPA: c-type cytochrome, partial [Candidatus Eisenbacteria bacterium]|nr:c-type cytochrome [Candidatus Eisenbacteria bacterium]
ATATPDWKNIPSAKLVELLSSKNDWFVRKARRTLADRRDTKVVPQLRKMIFECGDNHIALEALWALYVSDGFNDKIATKLLSHPSGAVRKWTVRLLGDENKVSASISKTLIDLAGTEEDVHVRSQLACTAKRLRSRDGLPIVEKVLARNLDAKDPYLPLLLWWAVERNTITAKAEVLEMFASANAWQQPLTREIILPRLMQRYAAEGTKEGLTACARLLETAPITDNKIKMMAALDQGLPAQISTSEVPTDLQKQLGSLLQEGGHSGVCLRVLARLGDADAGRKALALAMDKQTPAEVRVEMLNLLGELGQTSSMESILGLVISGEPESIQLAALGALQRMPNTDSGKLLEIYPTLKGRVRSKAREVLLSREPSALAFLKEIDSGKLSTTEIPLEELPKIALLKDKESDDLVRKHWGNVTGGTPEEKLAVVRRFNNDLRAADGDKTRGHEVFTKTCAICHRLFGEGAQVGPDLTGANRKDRDYLLVNIVDPSAVIRKEFLNYNVEMTDGQFVTGLIAEQSADRITLLAANNERTTIGRDKIKSLQESPVSLMPENLLNALKPQELRDLFAYLQADKP